MKQAEAKQRAETLLDRKVKMRQKNGLCCIFPATTKGLLLESMTFSKTTDYYGGTWDEALVKIEDHVRFDTTNGRPVEAELIRCPNCGDHENLSYDEVDHKFTCAICNHEWVASNDMTIVAEEAPPRLTDAGNVEGQILLTDREPETTKQEGA